MGYPEAQYVIDELGKNIDDVKSSMSSGVETFTESGTFIVPEGVTKIWVTACGGGAGGNGGIYMYNDESYGGSGGQGGSCIIREPFHVTPGQSIPITIGEGGAAGGVCGENTWGNRGSAGGSTVIGDLITLPGGAAVYSRLSPNEIARRKLIGSGRGGKGAYASSSKTLSAENGEDGVRGIGGYIDFDPQSHTCGGGGGGSYGNGAVGASYTYGDATVAGYGGGGGGGNTTSASGRRYLPSDGGSGIAIIEW